MVFLLKPSKNLLYPQVEGEGLPDLRSNQLPYVQEFLTIVQQINSVMNVEHCFLVHLMILWKFSQVLSLQLKRGLTKMLLQKGLLIRSKK